jgi:GNAT superfamily N-acetyltransferase
MLTIRGAGRTDRAAIARLLEAADLEYPGFESFDPDTLAVVADWCGQVVGLAEFDLDCDFGRPEGRGGHPGRQAWVFALVVDERFRRCGIGRALLSEVARCARRAGRTYLGLVPQDGEPGEASGRLVFFRRCGLVPLEPCGPGAAWGCPIDGF